MHNCARLDLTFFLRNAQVNYVNALYCLLHRLQYKCTHSHFTLRYNTIRYIPIESIGYYCPRFHFVDNFKSLKLMELNTFRIHVALDNNFIDTIPWHYETFESESTLLWILFLTCWIVNDLNRFFWQAHEHSMHNVGISWTNNSSTFITKLFKSWIRSLQFYFVEMVDH